MTGVYIFAELVFTFIEVVTYFAFVHAIKPDQFPKRKQILLLTVIATAISCGILLLNLVNFTSMLMTMIYALLVYSVGACILYKGKFTEMLLIVIYCLTGLNLIEGFMFRIVSIFCAPELVAKVAGGFCMERLIVVSVLKLIEIVLVFGVYCLIKHMAVKIKASWKALIISAIGFTVAYFWIVQASNVLNMRLSLFDGVLVAVCILLCLVIYFLIKLRKIQQEQEYTEFENKLLKKNYQVAEQSYESNAKLYHDMRNHFSLLQTYLAEGKVEEAQQYLQRLGNDSQAYSVEKWTGVEAIDYILSQKVEKAKQNDIDATVQAEYPKECSIDPVDLCTVLTNLFDNAIEACMKQPAGADRKIGLTIRRIHQFIIIKIENSSAEEPTMKSGSLVTSKKDGKHHGWGMKSVKSAVEKYNGTIEHEYKDGTFSVSVMMFYQ